MRSTQPQQLRTDCQVSGLCCLCIDLESNSVALIHETNDHLAVTTVGIRHDEQVAILQAGNDLIQATSFRTTNKQHMAVLNLSRTTVALNNQLPAVDPLAAN